VQSGTVLSMSYRNLLLLIAGISVLRVILDESRKVLLNVAFRPLHTAPQLRSSYSSYDCEVIP